MCPAGSYCPSTGLSAAWTCPVNSTCPVVGLSQAWPCPSGASCASAGLTAFGDVACASANSFCPLAGGGGGSAAASTAVSCPPGMLDARARVWVCVSVEGRFPQTDYCFLAVTGRLLLPAKRIVSDPMSGVFLLPGSVECPAAVWRRDGLGGGGAAVL